MKAGIGASPSDGSPRVRIDPRQLDQVIVNLALNARNAMPVDGTLTMTTEEVDLTEGSPWLAVHHSGWRYDLLVMRDTGVGMDSATQARIFEAFFTTKPVGLAASCGIVKALGPDTALALAT